MKTTPIERAMVGVPQCPACGAIGTITQFNGKCCAITTWANLGGLWNVPSPMEALTYDHSRLTKMANGRYKVRR